MSVEGVVANYSNSVMEEGLTHFKRQNVSIQKRATKFVGIGWVIEATVILSYDRGIHIVAERGFFL